MASLLQNVVVSKHPFEYDISGLSVSGFTRMRPERLTEIIRSAYADRKPSVRCRVRDRNFLKDSDWIWAQLELYGIDTRMESEQPRSLPETLEDALEHHLLDEPTDYVTALEAKLKRKYTRECLRRTDELLGRYSAGSSQHKELMQMRHSIRADIKQDRRDREMPASPHISWSEITTFDRDSSSSPKQHTADKEAYESALSRPSNDLASMAAVANIQGVGRLGLTSSVTHRSSVNMPREEAPSHLEQPQRSLGSCVQVFQPGSENGEAQLQSPTWTALNSLSEEANFDPESFVAKHFLDKSKKHKDQTKTPLPIALSGLNDSELLTRLARNRSVIVRLVPDAHSSTLILGWNGKEVRDIASSYPTKYPEQCKKRKAEWELSPESKRRKRNADRQRKYRQSKVTIVDSFKDVFHHLPPDSLSPYSEDWR